MDSLKLGKNICRICLVQQVFLSWNDEILEFSGISYRDCYFKYTKLEEIDPDPYPIGLCDKCAEELKTSYMLFEKAQESFYTLQKMFKKHFDADDVAKTDGNESDTKINIELYEANKMIIKQDTLPEVTHFIDIQNLNTSEETLLEEQLGESGITETSKQEKIVQRRKRKNVETTLTLSWEQKEEECSDTKQSPTIRRRRRRKNCKISNDDIKCSNSCEHYENISKEIEPEEISMEATETKTTKKSREKYLLMCSYCSLKVEGAKKLEKHEATHNENRERTVVCPECGIKLYTDCSLNLHMKVHDTNRQKNHKCEFCEKAFFNKGALNVHRRIHLGLMIKCQICEKEFFRQIDLDKHLLKHSSSPLEKNVGKKKYVAQCQYCNKSVFTDKLKEHIAVHLDQPQVKCKICDKNFYSREKCTNHLRRFHLKKLSEYEEFIHYYVDRNTRLSSLMIKQKLVVQPLSK